METKSSEPGVTIPLSVIYDLLIETRNEVKDLHHKIDAKSIPCATDKGCPALQEEAAGVRGHIKALWIIAVGMVAGLMGLGWKGFGK